MRLIIFTLTLALAAIPVLAEPLGTGFTYQGELQVSGAPANGDFDFTFALFDASAGGTELGAMIERDDVAVTDGIFAVELDFTEMPFAGEQLWIDIAVREGDSSGGYTGLLPRQKLTAAPYALHAEMVATNAIGSAEIGNNTVTAADIAANAVGASELGNNAVDTAAIANEAVTAAKLAANAVGRSKINSSEVQERVTGTCSAGAFAAGVNQDGSLNCLAGADTYTDADAVAAVLAADGEGSGLDADLLDGQDAAQLLQASRVGTAIDSVPVSINQPGRYYFSQNLEADGSRTAAIEVLSGNVTIDFNGYVLTGAGADPATNTQSGIWLRITDNSRILNGTIRRFGGHGIRRAIASNAHVIGMAIEDVGANGINLSFMDGVLVRDSHVKNAVGDGIVLGSGLIDSSFVEGSGGDGVVIGEGIVRNSNVTENGGEGIQCGGPCLVTNNVIRENTGAGISIPASAVEIDNVLFNNGP